MRPHEYTDSAIIKAGQRLQAKTPARRITPSAIRTELGGGGLARMKRVWADHAAKPYASADVPLKDLSPEEVAIIENLAADCEQMDYAQMVGEIYIRARTAVQNQRQSPKARDKHYNLQRELDSAIETIDRLERENHKLRDRLQPDPVLAEPA